MIESTQKKTTRLSPSAVVFPIAYMVFVVSYFVLSMTPAVTILTTQVWVGSLLMLGLPRLINIIDHRLLPSNFYTLVCVWATLGAIQAYFIGVIFDKFFNRKKDVSQRSAKPCLLAIATFAILVSLAMLSGLLSRDVYFYKPPNMRLSHYADIIRFGFKTSIKTNVVGVDGLLLHFPHSRTAALTVGDLPSRNPKSLSLMVRIDMKKLESAYSYKILDLSLSDGNGKVMPVLPEKWEDYKKDYQIIDGSVRSIRERNFVFNPKKLGLSLLPALVVQYEMPGLPAKPKNLILNYEVEIKTPAGGQEIVKGQQELELIRYVLPFYDDVK